MPSSLKSHKKSDKKSDKKSEKKIDKKLTKKEKVKPQRRGGVIHFSDFPSFKPNLSPSQVLKLGSFGGTYFRPIYSSINNRVNAHREKPINSKQILEDIPDCMTKIYQYYYKTYQIQRLSDAFGYDFK